MYPVEILPKSTKSSNEGGYSDDEDVAIPLRLAPRNNHVFLGSFCHRLWTAVVGILVGLVTFFPNLMMSDSGTPAARRAATCGMLASLFFVLGGIIGAVYGRPWYGWFWLLPGLILQISMFVLPW